MILMLTYKSWPEQVQDWKYRQTEALNTISHGAFSTICPKCQGHRFKLVRYGLTFQLGSYYCLDCGSYVRDWNAY